MPTGGPPTTSTAPGAPAAPPPDPKPILSQVDSDLAQLTAIDDYKAAQALVSTAQAQVTAAGAALQSARNALTAAQQEESQANGNKAAADAKLRSMAVAAYIGVGYTTPGYGPPSGGNGNQGPGTVSTPGGLTGVRELDAKEMLILVGQKARQNDDSATRSLTDTRKAVQTAAAGYARAQAGVGSAERSLLAAQQTLKQVVTAATTPGVATATPLPNLASLSLASAALTGARPSTGAAPGQAPAVDTAAVGATPAAPASPAILGPSVLTGSDLAGWFASTGHQANATVPIAQLAQDYQTWGQKTGVRYDLAFAQSVVETGFFSFPAGGQLTAKDNNFAGIGACDSCAHGWSFPDASTGVGAQLELLYEYASPTGLPKSLPDVIGANGPGGCCQTWTQLAGVWASSTVYGISIMTVYHQMLTWLIPQREAAAGLVPSSSNPTTATAQGPQLAPLPAAPQPGPNQPAATHSAGAPGGSSGSKAAATSRP
ncbi:MAG TPA: hypothetical protein VFN68_10630 [Acidimicrobiales bacterium]|nr:hypothetical protein [Acidimicrobiales bacterium]